MVNVENNVITITRGDTFEKHVGVYDDLNDEYTPDVTDRIRFALKSHYGQKEPLIVKQIDPRYMILRLEADETKQLKARTAPYVYDIELRTLNDVYVRTIISSELYVTEEVL